MKHSTQSLIKAVVDDGMIQADIKFKDQHLRNNSWFLVLAEEFGEVGKALSEGLGGWEEHSVDMELIHVIVVAMRWLADRHEGYA